MATGDRERWDAKYRGRERPREAPDPFVVAMLDRLGPGAGRTAVDLGAGDGRHALELARRGWRARAWDVSPVGLAVCAAAAEAAGLRVETRVVDLVSAAPGDEPADRPPDGWRGGRTCALALAVNFLERPLWRRLDALVAPGGHALLTTFTRDWPAARPPARYRLAPGELAGGLPGFETVEAFEVGGRAGILARRRTPGAAGA